MPGRRAAPASGKSTLLGAVNGLVPHFTGGTLAGRVTRRPAATPRPTRRASWPTWSASSARTRWPASSPTPSRRSSPTAWSSWRVPPAVMRKRVEETLDLLGLAELRDRPLRDALRRPAAAGRDRLGADRAPAGAGARRADLGARPDRGRGGAGRDHPAGARPRHHGRAGRAPAGAGGAVRRPGAVPGRRRHGGRRAAGRAAGDQRRSRRRSSSSAGSPAGHRCRCRCATPAARPAPLRERLSCRPRRRPDGRPASATAPIALTARGVAVRLRRRRSRCARSTWTLRRRRGRRADGPQRLGQVLAAVGAAGLRAAAGRHGAGRRARDPARLSAAAARQLVGLVPQTPATCSTWTRSAAECAPGRPASRRRPPGACRALLDRLAPGIAGDRHPRDLSEGQRLALVLAVQLPPRRRWCCSTSRPAAWTTRPRRRLAAIARASWPPTGTRRGRHPRRRVRRRASPTGWSCSPTARSSPTARPREVRGRSPAFAPQVAKILAPLPWLTVGPGGGGAAYDRACRLRARGADRAG